MDPRIDVRRLRGEAREAHAREALGRWDRSGLSAAAFARREGVNPVKGALRRYLRDGAIPIDNNAVEREIRTVAVGRGNWTFIGSEDAGPWAARLYGLLGTCRLQGVNPQEWLADVLARVREHPPDRMHELTPRGWRLAREARREGGP